jgi:hypothetical protein
LKASTSVSAIGASPLQGSVRPHYELGRTLLILGIPLAVVGFLFATFQACTSTSGGGYVTNCPNPAAAGEFFIAGSGVVVVAVGIVLMMWKHRRLPEPARP